jgi:hypothetical protein
LAAGEEVLTDEEMWAGWFGVQYTTKFAVAWRERIPFMKTIIEATKARSVLDVGTNAGWNLRALQEVDETLSLRGLEINKHTACSAAIMGFETHGGSAIDAAAAFPDGHDLVMTSGVLIHIEPHKLPGTMKAIIAASRRWVLAVEYYADDETLVRPEREGAPRTWARPFGRLYQELGLTLVEHGTGIAGYPDCNYWLLRK